MTNKWLFMMFYFMSFDPITGTPGVKMVESEVDCIQLGETLEKSLRNTKPGSDLRLLWRCEELIEVTPSNQ